MKTATEIGQEWAEILMLRRDPRYRDRYQTTWGNKTAEGLYHSIIRMVLESKESEVTKS